MEWWVKLSEIVRNFGIWDMALRHQNPHRHERLNLQGSKLQYADIREMNYPSVNFRRVDFRHAILTDTNFAGADFRDADLSGAETTGTNFSAADLRGATITLDQLARAVISPETKLPGGMTHAQVASRATKMELILGRSDG